MSDTTKSVDDELRSAIESVWGGGVDYALSPDFEGLTDDEKDALYIRYRDRLIDKAAQLFTKQLEEAEIRIRAESVVTWLQDTQDPNEAMHFLGIMAYLYVMKPTNATRFSTTLKGFSHKGIILGDMKISAILTQDTKGGKDATTN